jgi:hypothetical protein
MKLFKIFLMFSLLHVTTQASDPVGFLLYKKLYDAYRKQGMFFQLTLSLRVKELVAYREPDLKTKKEIVKIAIFKNDKEYKEVNHIKEYQGLNNYLPVNKNNYSVHYHYFVDADQIFLAKSLETAFPLLKVFEVLNNGWLKIKVNDRFLYVLQSDDFYFDEDLMEIIKHTDRKLGKSMYNHCEDKFHKLPPLFKGLPSKEVFIDGYYFKSYKSINGKGVVKISVLIGSSLSNFTGEDKVKALKNSASLYTYADIDFEISYKKFEECFDPFTTYDG